MVLRAEWPMRLVGMSLELATSHIAGAAKSKESLPSPSGVSKVSTGFPLPCYLPDCFSCSSFCLGDTRVCCFPREHAALSCPLTFPSSRPGCPRPHGRPFPCVSHPPMSRAPCILGMR